MKIVEKRIFNPHPSN